eukprot:7180655-Karenia_brevis.AAC.1
MEEAVAQEMVAKARSLSKPGVVVRAPKTAEETVARSHPSSSSNSWNPRRSFNPNLERPPGALRGVELKYTSQDLWRINEDE